MFDFYFYFFLASLLINLICFFLIFRLIKREFSFGDNISFIAEMIDDFCIHLGSVYKMELFYGDETLKNLLDHSNELRSELLIYGNSLAGAFEDIEEELEEDFDDDRSLLVKKDKDDETPPTIPNKLIKPSNKG